MKILDMCSFRDGGTTYMKIEDDAGAIGEYHIFGTRAFGTRDDRIIRRGEGGREFLCDWQTARMLLKALVDFDPSSAPNIGSAQYDDFLLRLMEALVIATGILNGNWEVDKEGMRTPT